MTSSAGNMSGARTIGFTGTNGIFVRNNTAPATREANGGGKLNASSVRRRFEFDVKLTDLSSERNEIEETRARGYINAGGRLLPGEGIKIDIGAEYLEEQETGRDRSHVNWIAENESKLDSLRKFRPAARDYQEARPYGQPRGPKTQDAPKPVSKPAATIEVYRSPFRKYTSTEEEAGASQAQREDKTETSPEKERPISVESTEGDDNDAEEAELYSKQPSSDSTESDNKKSTSSTVSSTTATSPADETKKSPDVTNGGFSEQITSAKTVQKTPNNQVAPTDSPSSAEDRTLEKEFTQPSNASAAKGRLDQVQPEETEETSSFTERQIHEEPKQTVKQRAGKEEQSTEAKSDSNLSTENNTDKSKEQKAVLPSKQDRGTDDKSFSGGTEPTGAASGSRAEEKTHAQKQARTEEKTRVDAKSSRKEDFEEVQTEPTRQAGRDVQGQVEDWTKAAQGAADSAAKEARKVGKNAQKGGQSAQKRAQAAAQEQTDSLPDNVQAVMKDAAEEVADGAEFAAKQAAEAAAQVQEKIATTVDEQVEAVKDNVQQVLDVVGDIFGVGEESARQSRDAESATRKTSSTPNTGGGVKDEHKTSATRKPADDTKEARKPADDIKEARKSDSTSSSTNIRKEQAGKVAEKPQSPKISQPVKTSSSESARVRSGGGRSSIIDSVLNTMKNSSRDAAPLPIPSQENKKQNAKQQRSVAGVEISKLRDQSALKRLTVPRLKEILGQLGLKVRLS